MLPRVLEPEVMDSLEEAVDYDRMDHSHVNRLFAEDLFTALETLATQTRATIHFLDVGTGTAQIPIEICRTRPDIKITAIDLAARMLQLAQRNVIQSGLTRQIRLEQVDAKALPFGDGSFDGVISNSIVHHIPEPLLALREMRRVVRPAGLFFVRDLLRPCDEFTLDLLVTTYAGDANDHQRLMFRNSLHAALTLDELRALARQVGLPKNCVAQTSDRHWTLCARVGIGR